MALEAPALPVTGALGGKGGEDGEGRAFQTDIEVVDEVEEGVVVVDQMEDTIRDVDEREATEQNEGIWGRRTTPLRTSTNLASRSRRRT